VNLILIGNCVMSCVFQFLYRIGHADNMKCLWVYNVGQNIL
jgi:hypothetical protein